MSEALERRLQVLEDERAITKRLYAYSHAIDYGDEEAFVDCFTADAVLSYNFDAADSLIESGMAKDMYYTGRDEIAAFVQGHTNAPNVYHKHFLLEPVIEVDGDRATVDSYYARIDRSLNGPLMSSFGRYRDLFVRCDDGRWRIQQRRGETEGRVPQELKSVL